MKRLAVTCILLFAITRVDAQQTAVADSLVMYEKLIFHSQDEHVANGYILQKAGFLKRNNSIASAYTTYNRINESLFTDSLKADVYFQRALCAYLLSNYTECDLHLSKMKYFLSDSSWYTNAMWLHVLSLNEQYRWNEAKEIFRTYVQLKQLPVNVDSVYQFAGKVKLKKEKTAEILSTFLPGAGQLYIGEYRHGLLNGAILLSCLGWGTFNVLNGYYLTGVFTGYFVGYSFYTGGMRYASDGVKRSNARIAAKYNTALQPLIIPQ
jgi:TM2 domain-containing membrane protein YozV